MLIAIRLMSGCGKSQRQNIDELTTPSAPLRWLRDFLLLAQPPLLFKEGKRAHYQNNAHEAVLHRAESNPVAASMSMSAINTPSSPYGW